MISYKETLGTLGDKINFGLGKSEWIFFISHTFFIWYFLITERTLHHVSPNPDIHRTLPMIWRHVRSMRTSSTMQKYSRRVMSTDSERHPRESVIYNIFNSLSSILCVFCVPSCDRVQARSEELTDQIKTSWKYLKSVIFQNDRFSSSSFIEEERAVMLDKPYEVEVRSVLFEE